MFPFTSVIFTVHFSNIDFVLQISGHILPHRLKVFTMSTPRSIEFDKPRFFTVDNIFQLLRVGQLDALAFLVSFYNLLFNILVYALQGKVASILTPSTSIDVRLNGGSTGNTLFFTVVEMSSTVDFAKVSSRMSFDKFFPFRFYMMTLVQVFVNVINSYQIHRTFCSWSCNILQNYKVMSK